MQLSPRVADRAEQGIAAVFYLWFCYRIGSAIAAGAADLRTYAVLVVDGVVLLFMLLRRPTTTISLRAQDWAWAMLATIAPLLLIPAAPLAPGAGVALVLAGMAVGLNAKLVLRRSFGVVAANRGVKVADPYRIVRHPMYAGYVVTHIGTLLLLPHLWNWVLFLLAWTAMAKRIAAEERVLRDDASYTAYTQRVRFRLLPGAY